MEWKETFPEAERKKLVSLAIRSLRSDEGKHALDYLKQERGLSDEIIDLFQIGYCPAQVDHQLSGRIITPIHDPYGDVVALSTRHLERKKDFWHESFDKGFYLYGLHCAKPSIIKYQKAIVVEGEFDTGFLHSNDLPMTVGVCGSAFTSFHAGLLARYCTEVYLVFDADVSRKQGHKGSGQMAIDRAMEVNKSMVQHTSMSQLAVTNLCVGMNFIPVYLPEGSDPDDFVRLFGRLAFIELLKNAKQEHNKRIIEAPQKEIDIEKIMRDRYGMQITA